MRQSTYMLDDLGHRRLRACAAVEGCSQGELIRRGLDREMREIESRHPEARRLADVAA